MNPIFPKIIFPLEILIVVLTFASDIGLANLAFTDAIILAMGR